MDRRLARGEVGLRSSQALIIESCKDDETFASQLEVLHACGMAGNSTSRSSMFAGRPSFAISRSKIGDHDHGQFTGKWLVIRPTLICLLRLSGFRKDQLKIEER
jgi:hypothetical protein